MVKNSGKRNIIVSLMWLPRNLVIIFVNIILFVIVNNAYLTAQIQVAGDWDSWVQHTMEYYGTWDGINLYMYKGITLNSNTQYQYKYIEHGTWVGKDSAPNYYLTNSSSYACQASDFYSGNGNAYVNPLLKTQEYVFYYQTNSLAGDGYGILKPASVQVVGNFTGWDPKTAPDMSKFSNNGGEWYGYHIYFSKATNLNFKFIQGHTYAGFYWCWSGAGSSSAPVTNAVCVRSTTTATNSISVSIPYAGVWHFYFNPKDNKYSVRQGILISHFDTTGNGTTSNDSIEIYNPNPFSLSLNGYRVIRFTSTGTFDWSVLLDGYTVPAFGYLLLASVLFTDVPPDIIDASISITATAQSFGIVIDNDNDPDDGDGYKVDGIGTDAPTDNKLGEGSDFNVGTDGDGYWRIAWDTNGNYSDTDDNATDFGTSGTYRDHNSRELNTWHIYNNTEPGTHKMRETTNPWDSYNPRQRSLDTVTVWAGVYPQVSLTNATLYYKATNLITWNSVESNFITNSGVNRYFRFQYSQPDTSDYDKGDRVGYYIKMWQTSTSNICYICEYNGNSMVTANEEFAKRHPFKYTIANDGPMVTNLIQPIDGDTSYYSRRPKFIWSRAYDRDGDLIQNYHIWISTNADFSDTVTNTDTSSTNPWYACPVTLDIGKTYYWRVTAYDGSDWGPYSETNSFQISSSFIMVDGSLSDWGNPPGFTYGSNTCKISNGIWWWRDGNDERTDGTDPDDNYDIEYIGITANNTNIYFLIKLDDISDAVYPYIGIGLDTNCIDTGNTGNTWFADYVDTEITNRAAWDKEIVVNLNKTGLYDTSWNWSEVGESWIDATSDSVEIGMPWSDLGFSTPPRKLRISIIVAENSGGGTVDISGSDVLDCMTTVAGDTGNEVSDGKISYFAEIYFNDTPYNDTHGGHVGLVYPDHFTVAASRSSTKPGIEFNLTNRVHAHNCGCAACTAEHGSIVPDYNGTITHTLSPAPAGDLLRTKTTGFSDGKLVEQNVILNQIGASVNIKIQDSNVSTFTGSLSMSSTRPSIHINEVNLMPVGTDDNNEWVEIYSKESESLNLTNWYLTDEDGNGYHITKNVIINRGDFLVLYDGTGTDDTDFSDKRGSLYGDWGLAILTPTDDTSTSGDESSLYSSFASLNPATIIDFVGWDGDGIPTSWADYANATNAGIWTNGKVVLTSDTNIDEGNTIALLPSGDDGNSSADWVARAFPTPGYSNYLHPVIQEIANSPAGNNYAEYIEIFNPCPYEIDISGWAICDPTSSAKNPRVFPAGTIIKSNGFILCGRNANNFYSEFKFYPDFEWDTVNGGDNVEVSNLLNPSYSINILNNDTFFLVGSNYLSADVSIDAVVIGIGDDGTNQFPEGVWRGNNAPALNTSQALRRVPYGTEGPEDDDNIRTDSDISAENNEDLSTVFKLTNWDPNIDGLYYVSWRNGDDTRTEFEAHHINTPWKTLARTKTSVKPGDIVLILPGTNREAFYCNISGSENSNIVYSGYSNNSYLDSSGTGDSYGIWFYNSKHIILKKLNIISATNGLFFNGGSSDITLVTNNIFNNIYGISIDGWGAGVTNLYIYNNSICSNTTNGIKILNNNIKNVYFYDNKIYGNGVQGVYLNYCRNVKFSNNRIYNNTGDGIHFIGTPKNIIIVSNNIYSNKDIGITIWNAQSNIFSGNKIHNNVNGGFHCGGDFRKNYITNNIIYGETGWAGGIYLTSTANSNFLRNNTIYSLTQAAIVVYGNGNRINNNTIGTSSDSGILIGNQAKGNMIKNNSCSHMKYNGIKLQNTSLSNLVQSNVCFNNYIGIGLYNSTNGFVINNVISNSSGASLYLSDYSVSNNIINNTLLKRSPGIYIYNNSSYNYVKGNLVTGSSGWGSLIRIQSASGNKIYTNECYKGGTTLHGIEVVDTSSGNVFIGNKCATNAYGIYLNGSSVTSSTLINNYFYTNTVGIYVWDGGNNLIQNNICSNNFTTWGVEIYLRSTDNRVIDNRCIANNKEGDGIKVEGTKNNTIKGNYVSQHNAGIVIWKSTNNRFINNTLTSNNWAGIYFSTNTIGNIVWNNYVSYNGSVGIYLYYAANNIIQQSKIHHNNGHGIYIAGAGNNNIFYRDILYRNSNYGIGIANGTSGNIINHITSVKNSTWGIVVDNNVTVKNCITYSNSSGGVYGNGANSVTYSCINDGFGGFATAGTGTITNDPLFKSISDGSEDFHLKWNSPCQFTAEPSGNIASAMGAYVICVSPVPLDINSDSKHEIVFESVYSNNIINAGDTIYADYEKSDGSASDFKFSNTSKATTTSSWGSIFNSVNNSGQNLSVAVNSGNTVPARPENVIFYTVTNTGESTNRVRFFIVDSTGETNEYPEYSNDFRIYDLSEFYVNDSSTTGDIYTYNAGSDYTGNGTKQKPFLTISKVINDYNLTAGDKVWVDNGTYNETVTITSSDSGTNNNYLSFIGAGTNTGSMSKVIGTTHGFLLNGCNWVKIMGFYIRHSANHGILINNNAKHNLIFNNTISSNIWSGIQLNAAYSNDFVKNEICSNAQAGFDFWQPNANNNITSNNIYKNIWDGVLVRVAGINNKNVIKHNYISENRHGVLFQDVASNNSIISNYICDNYQKGIYFENIAYSNSVIGNYITNNAQDGIYLIGSGVIKSFVRDNEIYKNTSAGIVIGNFSSDNKILHNTIYSNYWGAYLDNCVNNIFGTNKIYYNTRIAFYLMNTSTNNSIFSNTIYSNGYSDGNGGNGVYLFGHNVSHNKVYNNVLFNNDYGSGLGDNIKIEGPSNTVYNNFIHSDGNGKGIILITTNAFDNYVYDNICTTNNYGIWIEQCRNNFINNNIITRSKSSGLFAQYITNNYLGTNVIYNNHSSGVAVYSGISNTFVSNYIHNNATNGIKLSVNSAKNTFVKNQIFSNQSDGFYIVGGSYSNTIYSNKIYRNFHRGVWNDDADYNVYYGNYFAHNSWQGFTVESGSISVIFSNNIVVSNANGNTTYGSGILVGRTVNNIIVDNTVYSNNPYGINLLGLWGNPEGAFVADNTVFNNKNNGIRLSIVTNVIIRENTVYKCTNGIILEGSSYSNRVIDNTVYSNYNIGIYLYNSRNNYILSNTANRNKYGVYLGNNSDLNIVKANNANRESMDGIYVGGSIYNRIVKNYTLTNTGNNGITFDIGASNNYCASNVSAYNAHGIRINNTSKVTLYRNAVFRQNGNGIWLTDGDNNYIYHNSVASNDIYGNYDNLRVDALSTGNIVINNIFAYAKTATGYGINIESGGSAVLKYNDVFSNATANYGGVAAPGNGSMSNIAGWLSYDIYSTNFLYLTNTSHCIDSGTNLGFSYEGPAPDMGWKEYDRPYVRLSVSKYISNVSLNSSDSHAVPGSTVFYKIEYEITGNTSANYPIIYDKIPNNTTYQTDFLGTATGWTVEYSTNDAPDQTYNSSQYSTVRPADKSKIKWIRWKKASESTGTKTLLYKVVIQ